MGLCLFVEVALHCQYFQLLLFDTHLIVATILRDLHIPCFSHCRLCWRRTEMWLKQRIHESLSNPWTDPLNTVYGYNISVVFIVLIYCTCLSPSLLLRNIVDSLRSSCLSSLWQPNKKDNKWSFVLVVILFFILCVLHGWKKTVFCGID